MDWLQLRSDVSLRAKVGLQAAGVLVAAPKSAPDESPPAKIRFDRPSTASRHDVVNRTTAGDGRAAIPAAVVPAEGRLTPMEHALEQPESRVSEEGANLIEEDPSGPVDARSGPVPVSDGVQQGKIPEASVRT